mmetsp:Transcript_78741/g.198714  ORF Transcript_78741/g.198714 Transcript_78741/m.198714 type:complete len:340 (+) Transcript_78741:212-1231(+)
MLVACCDVEAGSLPNDLRQCGQAHVDTARKCTGKGVVRPLRLRVAMLSPDPVSEALICGDAIGVVLRVYEQERGLQQRHAVLTEAALPSLGEVACPATPQDGLVVHVFGHELRLKVVVVVGSGQVLERRHLDVVGAIQEAEDRQLQRHEAELLKCVEVDHRPACPRGGAAEHQQLCLCEAAVHDQVPQGGSDDPRAAPVHLSNALIFANVPHPCVAAALAEVDAIVVVERAVIAHYRIRIVGLDVGVILRRERRRPALRTRFRIPAPSTAPQEDQPLARIGARCRRPIVDPGCPIVANRVSIIGDLWHAHLLGGVRWLVAQPVSRVRRELCLALLIATC